jgi:hypothetical protein
MPITLEGSCRCGAVRFSVASHTPYPYQLCYCTICRKTAGGGGFAINIMGDARTMAVTGRRPLRIYHAEISDEDGNCETSSGERHFCSKCASALWLSVRSRRMQRLRGVQRLRSRRLKVLQSLRGLRRVQLRLLHLVGRLPVHLLGANSSPIASNATDLPKDHRSLKEGQAPDWQCPPGRLPPFPIVDSRNSFSLRFPPFESNLC